jgi:hypothetical protein
VSSRDQIASGLKSGLPKERVPCLSARLLDSNLSVDGQPRDVCFSGNESDLQFTAERFAKRQFLVRVRPLAVVEMCGDDIHLQEVKQV